MEKSFDIHGPYISGLFAEQQSAETAYGNLLTRGYPAGEINVAIESTAWDKLCSNSRDQLTAGAEKPFNGPVEGSIMGGLMGGIAFAIGALGSNLGIRDLNLVLMGPFASGIVGSSIGAFTGGLLGYILSPDVPTAEPDLLTNGLKNGKILLAIKPYNKSDEAQIEKEWTSLDANVVIYTPK